MAPRKSKTVVVPDEDEDADAPRHTLDLIGHDIALARVARALRSGRIPPGWLITGPKGVGKATFAYRIARYLLRYGATNSGPENLSIPANDLVSAQVSAGAHPGLVALSRGLNPSTGKPMTVLSVDEVRKLHGFFGMTSGAGGWRVAIVDTADDMNDAAANALLKILEEPPQRAMLLVLSDAPGRLLPTIRSRCQRIDLRPLPMEMLIEELSSRLPDSSAEQREGLAKLSGGSIGAALTLANDDGVALASEANRLIDHAAKPDLAELIALGDRLGRMTDGTSRFGIFLQQVLADRIVARAQTSGANLQMWLRVSEKLKSMFGGMDALHLDPRQTILSAARSIGSAGHRTAL